MIGTSFGLARVPCPRSKSNFGTFRLLVGGISATHRKRTRRVFISPLGFKRAIPAFANSRSLPCLGFAYGCGQAPH
jgi:hypothetical protein